MNEFSILLQQGNAWFFIPSAILLGALHGLEPGHSKTMMAAFIIAIKGTVKQAIMLGIAATISHTAIVWFIAFGGMYLSDKFTAESAESWLELVSCFIILSTAIWLFLSTWNGERNWRKRMRQTEQCSHEHNHTHDPLLKDLNINSQEYQDAHELFHANDIKKRFSNKSVTNGQIVLFGLTGGLIPCPAAITVLLICIQLKALTLGAVLVLSFSIGLAFTLIAVGVGAALSVNHIAKSWGGFNKIARKAPYFSSILIGCVGIYMGIYGYLGTLN